MSDVNETTAPAAPKKRRLLLKILAALFVLVVLVVVFLPYLVPSAWIAAVAEKGIKAAINRDAVLGEVSWGWLSGVKVRDIKVAEREDFGGGVFLDVGAVSFHVDLARLVWSLGESVTINSLVIDSPRVSIVRTADGRLNIETLSRRPAGAAPGPLCAALGPAGAPSLDLAVSRVRVTNGAVVFKDLATGATVETAALEAVVKADFSTPRVQGGAEVSFELVQGTQNAAVAAEVESFAVDRRASPAVFKTAAARGTLKIEGIEIAEALADVPGVTSDFASGRLFLEVDYEIEEGKIDVAAANGRIDDLVLAGAAVASGPVEIGDITLSLKGHGDMAKLPSSLVLDSLEIAAPFARVAAGAPSLDPGALDVSFSGSVEPALVPSGLIDFGEGLEVSGEAGFTGRVRTAERPMSFSASVDASALGVSSGSLAKAAGTRAVIEACARITTDPVVLVFDRVALLLDGGFVDGTAEFDHSSKAAAWRLSGDFEKLDLARYLKTAEPIVLTGGLTHYGRFILGARLRESDFVMETKFADLAADVPSRSGTELKLAGEASVNSARATTSGLVAVLGGEPLTVDANIHRPLSRPTGKVTARAEELDFDNLAALVEALRKAAAAEGEAPVPSEPSEDDQEAAAEKGFFAKLADIYMNNADVTLDLKADRVQLRGYAGADFLVDAGLVAGKVLLRQGGFDIYRGRITLESTVDLSREEMPAQFSLDVAAVQAGEPVEKFLSNFLYGVDFAGVMNLSMAASGSLGGTGEKIAQSFDGDGSFTVTDGVLSLPGLAGALAQFSPGLEFSRQVFDELKGTLRLEKGTLTGRAEIPRGDGTFIIEGRVSHTGDNSQVVSVVPAEIGTPIRLVTVQNGKVRYEALPEDLLKAGLISIIGRELEKSGESDDRSDRDKAVELLRDVLSNIGGGRSRGDNGAGE